MIWLVFFSVRKEIPVPLGTNICFDDWCATITKYERLKDSEFGDNNQEQYIVFYTKMTNNAKRVAQKPSEPKVYLKDSMGRL